MNPVTRYLVERQKDRRLREFVHEWDALEALVIRIYKQKSVEKLDRVEHRRLLQGLSRAYSRWLAALAPYWQAGQIDGKPVESDPFLALLAVKDAEGFLGNWEAMQTLPAAREALNLFLMEDL